MMSTRQCGFMPRQSSKRGARGVTRETAGLRNTPGRRLLRQRSSRPSPEQQPAEAEVGQSGEGRTENPTAPTGRAGRRTGAVDAKRLDVVVEGELVRMRAQPDGVHLVLPLVVDPGLDQVRGEHVPLQQEVVVLLEVVQHDVERPRELLDLLLLGRGQLVEVLVYRL